MCWDSRRQAKKSGMGDVKGRQSKTKQQENSRSSMRMYLMQENCAIKNDEESKLYVMPKLCCAPHMPKIYEGRPPKNIIHL